jgi:AmmeMemoRadiSam system protein A
MNWQDRLSQEERSILLKLARQAIEEAVCRGVQLSLELGQLPQVLQENGASFVTLTKRGELRGCIGSLEASQPLAQDVCDHAAAAALSDFRFPPVDRDEVPELVIEISRLTVPIPLEYDDPNELLSVLRPGIDGVVIRDGSYRATFLPQVWEKIPDAQQFLSYLCRKMGVNAGLWRLKKLQILTYQVEEFHE